MILLYYIERKASAGTDTSPADSVVSFFTIQIEFEMLI